MRSKHPPNNGTPSAAVYTAVKEGPPSQVVCLFDLNFQLVESEVPHSSGPPGIAYCPVCFELITEPVVYPCVHEVCKACFEQCVATGNLHCPVCRHRISSWARRSKRNGCVVDEARQKKIAESLEEALGSGDVAKRELPQYECSIQVGRTLERISTGHRNPAIQQVQHTHVYS